MIYLLKIFWCILCKLLKFFIVYFTKITKPLTVGVSWVNCESLFIVSSNCKTRECQVTPSPVPPITKSSFSSPIRSSLSALVSESTSFTTTQFIDADTSCWAEMAFVHLLSILADNCQLEYPENRVLHWPAPLSLLVVYLKSFIMFRVLTQLLAFGSSINCIISLWGKTNNCDHVERHSVTDTMRESGSVEAPCCEAGVFSMLCIITINITRRSTISTPSPQSPSSGGLPPFYWDLVQHNSARYNTT